MVTKEYLQALTRPELSEYCRNNNIKGYSGKTKADRIKLILNSMEKKDYIPKEFRQKFNSIKQEYDWLNKKTKKELVRIALEFSNVDISYIKNEDKHSIRNHILGEQFSRKSLEEFDKYN